MRLAAFEVYPIEDSMQRLRYGEVFIYLRFLCLSPRDTVGFLLDLAVTYSPTP